MFRKRRITKIKTPLLYLFQNIFNDSTFSLTLSVFLAIAWTNTLFYYFDLCQAQFKTSETKRSMFS